MGEKEERKGGQRQRRKLTSSHKVSLITKFQLMPWKLRYGDHIETIVEDVGAGIFVDLFSLWNFKAPFPHLEQLGNVHS